MVRKSVKQSTWWQSVRMPFMSMLLLVLYCVLFLMFLSLIVVVVSGLVGLSG